MSPSYIRPTCATNWGSRLVSSRRDHSRVLSLHIRSADPRTVGVQPSRYSHGRDGTHSQP
eukprot:5946349-Prymnesium_polylepis.1